MAPAERDPGEGDAAGLLPHRYHCVYQNRKHDKTS